MNENKKYIKHQQDFVDCVFLFYQDLLVTNFNRGYYR